MGFRDIKTAARQALHNAMKVPASLYLDPDSSDAPVLIYVRLRNKGMKNGDMSGTNLSYAVVQDTKDRILFMRDEVPEPPRGALVIISSDEGYVVDNVEPPDGISVTAEVTRLDAAEMSGRLTPDEITAGS